jgi:hypothetical protein
MSTGDGQREGGRKGTRLETGLGGGREEKVAFRKVCRGELNERLLQRFDSFDYRRRRVSHAR